MNNRKSKRYECNKNSKRSEPLNTTRKTKKKKIIGKQNDHSWIEKIQEFFYDFESCLCECNGLFIEVFLFSFNAVMFLAFLKWWRCSLRIHSFSIHIYIEFVCVFFFNFSIEQTILLSAHADRDMWWCFALRFCNHIHTDWFYWWFHASNIVRFLCVQQNFMFLVTLVYVKHTTLVCRCYLNLTLNRTCVSYINYHIHNSILLDFFFFLFYWKKIFVPLARKHRNN